MFKHGAIKFLALGLVTERPCCGDERIQDTEALVGAVASRTGIERAMGDLNAVSHQRFADGCVSVELTRRIAPHFKAFMQQLKQGPSARENIQ